MAKQEMWYQITLVCLSSLHLITYTLNIFDGIPDKNFILFCSSVFLLLCFSFNLIYAAVTLNFCILRCIRKCLLVIVLILSLALLGLYFSYPFSFLNNKVIILMVCLFYFALETLTLTLFLDDCSHCEEPEVV